MEKFRALLVSKTETGQHVEITSLTEGDLMEGDVTIAVSHSSVNYKDGLGITGKSPIFRKYPMIPGIDLAGVVTKSAHKDYKIGHYGGYAQLARVNGDWLVPLPSKFNAAEAMAIGVAGYTAMLCVMALEEQGVKPEQGEILVTGAAGGVGSVSVALLSTLGFKVVASTGRMEEEAFLKSLGAASVVNRNEFNGPVKALAKTRWAGAIDSVGSTTLANVISQIIPEGTVAACGLAQGMDLPASVAPFILRGVRLIGVNSVTTPRPRRILAWERLARDLDMAKLHALTTTVKLDDVPWVAEEIVVGKVRGRVVVELN
jgi:acrylyl-CoA reductase (NADPH)